MTHSDTRCTTSVLLLSDINEKARTSCLRLYISVFNVPSDLKGRREGKRHIYCSKDMACDSGLTDVTMTLASDQGAKGDVGARVGFHVVNGSTSLVAATGMLLLSSDHECESHSQHQQQSSCHQHRQRLQGSSVASGSNRR